MEGKQGVHVDMRDFTGSRGDVWSTRNWLTEGEMTLSLGRPAHVDVNVNVDVCQKVEVTGPWLSRVFECRSVQPVYVGLRFTLFG